MVGMAADLLVGRSTVIQACIALQSVSALCNIALLILQMYLPSPAETVFAYFTEALCCIGGSCYIACVIPFTADQLIGAFGEQLSFTVYWMMWGFAIGYHTIILSFNPFDYLNFTAQVVAFLCLSTMAFILWYWNESLNMVPQQTNPYKLIFKVLNYARKHKYPERRSAFTYWEEDIPSRIDLGMSKYGGPFTVEEVEDVKTFLSLIPVILCAGGCNLGMYMNIEWEAWFLDEQVHISTKHTTILACSDILNALMIILGVPLYHFLIYPLFYNHIPTMLRSIGFGLFLLLCSFAISAMLGNILLCSSNLNVTCLFFHSEMFNISSNGLWWSLSPSIIFNLGYLISLITLFEFVFAQTPRSILGMMSGLIILSVGLSSFLGYGIYQLALNKLPITHTYSLFSSNVYVPDRSGTLNGSGTV